MTAAIKEYSGLPFDLAIGEVYGLRLWKIDKYGRLRARNWSAARPWRPGTNEAECLAEAPLGFGEIVDPTGKGRKAIERQARSAPSYWITWDDGSTEEYANVEFRRPDKQQKHPAPSENCQCGFYAYTNPDHREIDGYDADFYVLGIVKGTGRTLIGTQGFRCEKAEIVALRDPTRGGTKTDPWRLQQLDNLKRVYPDVPLLSSRAALLEFAPLTETLPDPSTDEFWSLP